MLRYYTSLGAIQNAKAFIHSSGSANANAFKDCNVRFRTLQRFVWSSMNDISIFCWSKIFFLCWFSAKLWLAHFLLKETGGENFQNQTLFESKTQRYLPHFWSDVRQRRPFNIVFSVVLFDVGVKSVWAHVGLI